MTARPSPRNGGRGMPIVEVETHWNDSIGLKRLATTRSMSSEMNTRLGIGSCDAKPNPASLAAGSFQGAVPVVLAHM